MNATQRSRQYPLLMLMGAVTVATVLPFVLFSTYSIYAREKEAVGQEHRRLSETANALSKGVDRELQNLIRLTETVAKNPALEAGDLLTFWDTSSGVAKTLGGHFVLTDHTSNQLISTRRTMGSVLPDVQNKRQIHEVLATGASHVSNMFTGSIEKEPIFVVRVPVLIGEKPRYVLSHVPRPGIILEIIQNTALPEGWYAAVLDRNGIIVARSYRHQDFYGKAASRSFIERFTSGTGLINSVDLEGRKTYTAYNISPFNGWAAVVWAPQALLEAPAEKAKHILYIALVTTALASALAALLAHKLISKPILQLQSAAEALPERRDVEYQHTWMAEANVVGNALSHASQVISRREAALKDHEDQLSLVIKELSHRTKNLLAVIQAMARQTMKGSAGPYLSTFQDRLGALSRSHDLLVGTGWSSVELEDLVRSQTETFRPHGEEKIRCEGPQILLKPEAAQSIGMALHELATNAAKYGALTSPEGWVRVTWKVLTNEEDEQGLLFIWKEENGPPCSPPDTSGFGHSILTRVVPSGLRGKATLFWHQSGCEWKLEVPLSALSTTTSAGFDNTPG